MPRTCAPRAAAAAAVAVAALLPGRGHRHARRLLLGHPQELLRHARRQLGRLRRRRRRHRRGRWPHLALVGRGDERADACDAPRAVAERLPELLQRDLLVPVQVELRDRYSHAARYQALPPHRAPRAPAFPPRPPPLASPPSPAPTRRRAPSSHGVSGTRAGAVTLAATPARTARPPDAAAAPLPSPARRRPRHRPRPCQQRSAPARAPARARAPAPAPARVVLLLPVQRAANSLLRACPAHRRSTRAGGAAHGGWYSAWRASCYDYDSPGGSGSGSHTALAPQHRSRLAKQAK
jgi:hypothetical protein